MSDGHVHVARPVAAEEGVGHEEETLGELGVATQEGQQGVAAECRHGAQLGRIAAARAACAAAASVGRADPRALTRRRVGAPQATQGEGTQVRPDRLPRAVRRWSEVARGCQRLSEVATRRGRQRVCAAKVCSEARCATAFGGSHLARAWLQVAPQRLPGGLRASKALDS